MSIRNSLQQKSPPENERYPLPLQELLKAKSIWAAESQAAFSTSTQNAYAAPFYISEIDSQLPQQGLRFGAVHEWFALKSISSRQGHGASLLPPLTLPAILIGNAFQRLYDVCERSTKCSPDEILSFLMNIPIFWIGQTCWPSAFLLDRALSLELHSQKTQEKYFLNRSTNCFFVAPQNEKQTLWATETILRSKGPTIVLAYCPRCNFTTSQRLSFAAEQSSSLGFLFRTTKDISSPSFATSRWSLWHEQSSSPNPHWRLRLLSLKAAHPATSEWSVEVQYDPESYDQKTPPTKEALRGKGYGYTESSSFQRAPAQPSIRMRLLTRMVNRHRQKTLAEKTKRVAGTH